MGLTNFTLSQSCWCQKFNTYVTCMLGKIVKNCRFSILHCYVISDSILGVTNFGLMLYNWVHNFRYCFKNPTIYFGHGKALISALIICQHSLYSYISHKFDVNSRYAAKIGFCSKSFARIFHILLHSFIQAKDSRKFLRWEYFWR